MNRNHHCCPAPVSRDHGAEPLVVNLNCLAKQNPYYRTTLWTGTHLQITLMCIPPHEDIGLEIHCDVDQFISIEDGCALVMMGKSKNCLNYQQKANCHDAVIVPAGTWHNVINTGDTPLKVYSIYAPPQHPFGTVHKTKKAAEDAEKY